jgi:transposase
MPSKYDQQIREKAVRLVCDHAEDYSTEWAAIKAVSGRLGMTAETLRKWLRQAEVDAGQRPGMSSGESAEIRALKRKNAELERTIEILKAATAYVGDRCQVPVWSSR